ncbi:MAG: ADP-ribosylation factor-like protein [Candidatus Hermodarchaeota archaeon]
MEDSIQFFHEEESTDERTYKILFTGLDGAGKTSIILTLQREFSTIALIEPTRGAQRRTFKLLGREISEWDLGGQKSYLISYLRNPGKYFDDTEVAIYVIDILDASRIHEALSYLYDVVKKFSELKIEPYINVFFHKYDPKLMQTVQKEIQEQIADLKNRIIKTLDYKKINFFITSIYDPYSIINAMSKILLELYPKTQLIQKTVGEFARKLGCHGLMIIDKNSIIIGSCFKDDNSKHILSQTIAYFLTLNDVFSDMMLEKQEDQIVVRRSDNYFLFKPIMLDEAAAPYYLLVLKRENPLDIYFMNKDVKAFVNIFKDIIKD